MIINATISRFGYPATLVAEFKHWVLLVRPTQPTLGSLVLAARGEATAFGDLPAGAHAELGPISKAVEGALAQFPGFQRINYLMLMMVDPHVHFHVIPRYDGERRLGTLAFPDRGWPGPPDLASALPLEPQQIAELARQIAKNIT